LKFEKLNKTIDDFMGGMGGAAGGRPQKEIDNTKYYTLLACKKDATTDEIKKSFRKIALKEHPDKGGDPEKVSIEFEY
jgi:DnaJ family protein A protein 2